MSKIIARYLYTLESPEPIEYGWAEVGTDGAVVAVGKATDTEVADAKAGSEVQWWDGIVCPGFVNTHCHVELSTMWKLFRKGTGMAGFIDQINELRDVKSHEEKLESIRHWMDLMWQRGVSAMADISNCSDTFAIKASSPMYTRTFLEVFGTEPKDCESVMSGVLALQRQAQSFGLDAAPTPHACYTMSPELLRASSAEALKSGWLSYHSEETQEEEDMLVSGSGAMWENRKRAGMSVPPVTGKSSLLYFIDNLLKVQDAPLDANILLVHEVCLNQEGIDAIKSTMIHPYIALCPMSNIFIHNALPPVGLMRSNGLKLTVGTDSLSSNDDLNIVSELLCLQENFPEIPLGEMLGWACRNGAEFLGKQDVMGTIAPGKKPGIVGIGNISREGRLTTASESKRLFQP